MLIISVHPNTISTKILSGEFIGTVHTLPRFPLTPSDSIFTFIFKRLQFLIRRSFANMNKSQGQALSTVDIYFPRIVFSCNVVYRSLNR